MSNNNNDETFQYGTFPDVPLSERLIDLSLTISIFQWQNLIFLCLFVVFLAIAKMVYTLPYILKRSNNYLLQTFNLNKALTETDNKSVGISFAGWLISVGFVLQGAFSKYYIDIGLTTINAVLWALFGFVLQFLCQFILDKVVLRRFNLQSSLASSNVATGALEAGVFIATGLITGASMTGTTDNFAEDLATCVTWFALGQVCLVLFMRLYQIGTKYDDMAEIVKGNPAAGIGFGLTIIALGMLLANPIRKGSDSLLAFTFSFVFGSIFLFLIRLFVDRFLLPGKRLDNEIEQDQNWGAAIIEGLMALAIAAAYNTFLPKIVLCPAGSPTPT